MGLTEAGYKLLCQPWPEEFYKWTNPTLGKTLAGGEHKSMIRKIGLRWQNDMRISNEAHTQRPIGFYTFRCDVHVFLADQNWDETRRFERGELPAADMEGFRKRCELNASPPDDSSYFGREPYNLWSEWTNGRAHFHTLDVDHQSLKNHPPAWEIVVRVLAEARDAALPK